MKQIMTILKIVSKGIIYVATNGTGVLHLVLGSVGKEVIIMIVTLAPIHCKHSVCHHGQ